MYTRKDNKTLTSCVFYWHLTNNCWWWSPINSCSCFNAPTGVSNSTRRVHCSSDYHKSPLHWQDQWWYHWGLFIYGFVKIIKKVLWLHGNDGFSTWCIKCMYRGHSWFRGTHEYYKTSLWYCHHLPHQSSISTLLEHCTLFTDLSKSREKYYDCMGMIIFLTIL